MTAKGNDLRLTRRFLVRSTLASVAFLLAAFPTLAVLGGYFPSALFFFGYGRLLVTDLPWLVVGAALALIFSTIAVLLGGGKFTAALSAGTFAVLVAATYVGIQFAALAASHGVTYDVLRQAQAPAPQVRGPDERVVYTTVAGQELHAEIWRPAQASGMGVMYIHGGAFVQGSPGLRPHLFANFADEGSVVVDIEYRLAPPPRWHDAPGDVLCALGWFQAIAPQYGVDPDRIVVMGDSAGGNLALIAAFGPGFETSVDPLVPSCDVVPAPPAGVIALYPTDNLSATWDDMRKLSTEVPFPEVYTGGTPIEYQDRYEAGSVQRLIRAGLPPTLLLTGVNDQLVLVGRVRDLSSTLSYAGSEVELVEVPFAEHAFDGPVNGFGSQLEDGLLPAFIDRVAGP